MTSLLPLIVSVAISGQPSCVHTEYSVLQYPAGRQLNELFYERLDAILDGESLDLNIWHIGGSHVQAGYFSDRLMNNFFSIAPQMKGDRGVIFPYQVAKTNHYGHYTMQCDGLWKGSRSSAPSPLPVKPRYSITGISAYTSDPSAAIRLKLGEDEDTEWKFTRLRILGYGSSPDVLPYVLSGTDTLFFSDDAVSSGYILDFPQSSDSAEIRIRIPQGGYFVLNGIQPLGGRPGINFFCSGVNGARTTTWLDKCELFDADFAIVHPDVAILAVGINDSSCSADDFKPEHFKDNYRRLLDIIQRNAPDCALIFVTNNDSYRYVGKKYMKHNDNGEAVRQAMFELAAEYNAAVWDLFSIMGGNGSAQQWKDEGLLRSDRLHFTRQGYELLGDLLFNAIVQDYNFTRGR